MGDALGRYAWAPDGTTIAYSAQSSFGPFQLYTYALAGGGPTQLTSESNPNSGDDFPAWSPDGTEIAYFHEEVSGSTQTLELNVLPLSGGSGSTLFDYSCTSCGVSYTMGPQAWSPDGSKVAYSFSVPPSADDDVYTVNADGSSNGGSTLVGGGSNGEWWPAWSADGNKLVVTVSDAGDNYLEKLYTIDASTGEETQLTDGGGDNSLYGDDQPTWATEPALSDAELLSHYAPQVRYDSQESFLADSASEITDNYTGPDYFNILQTWNYGYLAAPGPDQPVDTLSLGYLGPTYPGNRTATENDYIDEDGNYTDDAGRMHALSEYRNKIYGRVVAYGDTGERVIQYWLFYYYNVHPFDDHQGDWEMVQYDVGADGTPINAGYAQHNGGERCDWIHVQRTADGHPIVYPGVGSHASFFSSGTHVVGAGAAADFAGGDGEVAMPFVSDVTTAPDWMYWPGRWGSNGPAGPAEHGGTSPGGQWIDPRGWANGIDGCTEGQTYHALGPVRGVHRTRVSHPPMPKLRARRVGHAAALRYAFAPRARIAGLTLVVSVDSITDRRPPATAFLPVRHRSGRVVRKLVPGKGPFRLLVSVLSRRGRTPVVVIPLR